MCHITTNENEFITTAEHPFWVDGKVWVAAQRLKPEDVLLSQNKQLIKVSNVYIEELVLPVEVYNFKVEDWHTYFVGSQAIIAHNKCSLNKIFQSLYLMHIQ